MSKFAYVKYDGSRDVFEDIKGMELVKDTNIVALYGSTGFANVLIHLAPGEYVIGPAGTITSKGE